VLVDDAEGRIEVILHAGQHGGDDVGELLAADRCAGGVRRPDRERAPGLVGAEDVEEPVRQVGVRLGDPEVPYCRVGDPDGPVDRVLGEREAAPGPSASR
jgi:hypothetical protein